MGKSRNRFVRFIAGIGIPAIALAFCGAALAAEISGVVRDTAGTPAAGVLVTAEHAGLRKATTVFSGPDGAYRITGLDTGNYALRARRVGLLDVLQTPVRITGAHHHDFAMQQVGWDEAIHQLPASDWFARVKFPDPVLRGEFAIQCAMCHQQGSPNTRIPRTVEQWQDIFDKMSEMGALITERLRTEAPVALNAAYTLDHTREAAPQRAPVNDGSPGVVVTEWDVGVQTSMLHDIVVARDGRVYAADWIMDKVYQLDPATSARKEWDVPRGEVPPGGVLRSFAQRGRQYYHAIPHVAPHSLQMGPAGDVWVTLSLGRGLAQLNPETEKIVLHDQPSAGMYPHTLRFDSKGNIWYTLAMSNHVAKFDPGSGKFELHRLPTRTMSERFFVSTLKFWVWLADYFESADITVSDPEMLPIAYGIDIAPDGGVWFSQFNHRRIGRLDPETGEITMIDTPFYGPRRLRFDAKGILWIPAYAEGKIYRFDPADGSFRPYDMPTGPGDMPYALAVDKKTGAVWICGTNSDSIIRFDPATEKFTVYPLPTRVTFTREIDIDEEGNIWTSNSNLPGWQIEGGRPKLIRLSFN
ncbi:MAG: carboxypeptidase regulatory-like domain-containing protein [Myxococcota bacterium]